MTRESGSFTSRNPDRPFVQKDTLYCMVTDGASTERQIVFPRNLLERSALNETYMCMYLVSKEHPNGNANCWHYLHSTC